MIDPLLEKEVNLSPKGPLVSNLEKNSVWQKAVTLRKKTINTFNSLKTFVAGQREEIKEVDDDEDSLKNEIDDIPDENNSLDAEFGQGSIEGMIA